MSCLNVGVGVSEEHHIIKGDNIIGADIAVNDFNHSLVHVKCDAHFLPFKDKAFQKTICSHILEHLHTPLKAIKEWNRVTDLKVIVKVPNLTDLHMDESNDHIYTWSKASLYNLLSSVFPHVEIFTTERRMRDLVRAKLPFLRRTFISLVNALLPYQENELTAICSIE